MKNKTLATFIEKQLLPYKLITNQVFTELPITVEWQDLDTKESAYLLKTEGSLYLLTSNERRRGEYHGIDLPKNIKHDISWVISRNHRDTFTNRYFTNEGQIKLKSITIQKGDTQIIINDEAYEEFKNLPFASFSNKNFIPKIFKGKNGTHD